MLIRKTGSKVLRLGMAPLAALVLLAGVAAGPAAAAESEPSYCQSATLHDYLAPLGRMPTLRELPFRRKAEPRFRGVNIGASGPALAVGGGRAGYQFQWDKKPSWEITVTLTQVRGDGSVVREIGRRRLDLGALGQALIAEPNFALPSRPAFYRTTLAIRTSSGHKLAEFGNYYRVVRPTIHTRLVPAAATYRPGETVLARLENAGTAFALFGESFKVEERQGESWGPTPAVSEPVPTAFHFVAPGTASHCDVFPIPTTMPAGTYRLAQETVILWPGPQPERRPIFYAEFEVAAPAA